MQLASRLRKRPLVGSTGDALPAGKECKTPLALATNLRRFRKENGLSLEALAHRSGVSRAMLGQIETGKSVPTITIVWKIADALGVPIAALIEDATPARAVVVPRGSGQVLVRSDGRFTLRAIESTTLELQVAFYELRIAAGHHEHVEAHGPGTRASLVVTHGTLLFALRDGESVKLSEGDTILFAADTAHTYSNPGHEGAVAYLAIDPPRIGVSRR